MMPTLISLCQETTDKGTSNISYSYVHSTGNKLIPLDLYTGGHYPYVCKLDFIDNSDGCQINSPSNTFYISDTPNTPSRIWSQGGTLQVFRDGSANSSTTNEATRNSSAGNNSGSGIGAGIFAGAVTAALIGGAVIAGAGVFFWLRRRGNQHSSNAVWQEKRYSPQTTPDVDMSEYLELHKEDAGADVEVAELGEGHVIREMGPGDTDNHIRGP
ncbi:MAG: hypothetical protein Q9213_001446 [Squamulea squamosa]